MKKLFFIIFFISSLSMASGQNSDSLRRAAGFYFSPAISSFVIPDDAIQPGAHFGFSMGFRYINKLSKGFFLEGGAGFNLMGADYNAELMCGNCIPYGPYLRYWSTDQLFISAPLLAGYKTQKGKVRFQAALGISFNLKIMQFDDYTYEGNYYGYYNDDYPRPPFSFGTGFSAIARAGISIPVGKRLSIDLLPTARYQFLYFEPNGWDVISCMKTDEHKWSAGLDISLIWALDNKEPEDISAENREKEKNTDYTYQYNETDKDPIRKKPLRNAYRNFIYMELLGSGLSYTYNYERTMYSNGLVGLQARAGFGLIARGMNMSLQDMDGLLYTVPIGVNVSVGKGRKKFEAALGATMENLTLGEFNINIVPGIAYRYESKSHFFLRLALMTHYVTTTNKLLPGIGVSLGGGF